MSYHSNNYESKYYQQQIQPECFSDNDNDYYNFDEDYDSAEDYEDYEEDMEPTVLLPDDFITELMSQLSTEIKGHILTELFSSLPDIYSLVSSKDIEKIMETYITSTNESYYDDSSTTLSAGSTTNSKASYSSSSSHNSQYSNSHLSQFSTHTHPSHFSTHSHHHSHHSLESSFLSSHSPPIPLLVKPSPLQQCILTNITKVELPWSEEERVYYKLITNGYLPNLKSYIVYLKSLNISGDWTFLTNNSLANALPFLNNLETFSPSACGVEGNNTVKFFFRKGMVFYALKELDFTRVDLSEKDFKYLAHDANCHFPSLKTIKLGLKTEITKDSLDALALWVDTLPQLEVLSLFLREKPFDFIVDVFCKSPILTKITSLSLLTRQSDDETALKELLLAPLFKENRRMTEIAARNNAKHDKNLIDIIFNQSPHLSTLSHLTLSSFKLSREHIRIMCDSPYLCNLHKFEMGYCPDVNDEDVRRIAMSHNFRHLEEMILPSNRQYITSNSLRYIAESPYLRKLKVISAHHIDLSWTPAPSKIRKVKPDGLSISKKNEVKLTEPLTAKEKLTQSLIAKVKKKLKEQEIYQNPYFCEFIQHPSPNFTNLLKLSFNFTSLSLPCLKSLAQSKSFSKLTHLNLSGNPVASNTTIEWVSLFTQNPYFSSLTDLTAYKCNLDDQDVYHIAQSPYLSNITHLNLSCNRITDIGVEFLAQSPYINKLKALYLGENIGITVDSIGHLSANSRFFLSKMVYISMSKCDIDEEAQDLLPTVGWFDDGYLDLS